MERPGGRFETLKLLRALLSGKPATTVPGPRLPDPPPERRRDPRRHRPAPLDRHRRQENFGRLGARFGQPGAGGRRRRARPAARARPRPRRDPDRRDDPHAHRPRLGDLGVPQLDLRRQRGRVGGGDGRPETAAQRLPPRPLRLRLRLPHGRLRPRRDRLLRELRPQLRPLRRRLDPARLHARPQRRPHVGDLPARGARLRDRRRRHLHRRASSRAARRSRRAPSTPTTTAARCRS